MGTLMPLGELNWYNSFRWEFGNTHQHLKFVYPLKHSLQNLPYKDICTIEQECTQMLTDIVWIVM